MYEKCTIDCNKNTSIERSTNALQDLKHEL